jgi:hypothetical protein
LKSGRLNQLIVAAQRMAVDRRLGPVGSALDEFMLGHRNDHREQCPFRGVSSSGQQIFPSDDDDFSPHADYHVKDIERFSKKCVPHERI